MIAASRIAFRPDDLTLPPAACFAALKPLAPVGAHLVAISKTHWGLFDGKQAERQDTTLPVALVMELSKAGGLVIGEAGKATLSSSARAWLNRQGRAGARDGRRLEAFLADGGRTAQRLTNLKESPLTWLATRRDRSGRALISDSQLAAGERLRRDFTAGRLAPKLTAAWDPTAGRARQRRKDGMRTKHEQELSDDVYAARARVSQALKAVGPEFETILLDTCCFLRGVEESETRYGWPRRSAKLVLRLALSALARHYAQRARA
ncbi:MAG: DUF6456 domain-containing protein [Pseudomonadota bacterium]